tara:strand:- start:17088 stop:17837 length:750 start_codon:yes stop_codon:yes gene_type:complete
MEKNDTNLSICFFGHLRTFKRCLPYYKKLHDKFNIKYFMHTWSAISPNQSSWHSYDSMPRSINHGDIKSIKKYLPDLSLIIEDQNKVLEKADFTNRSLREKVFLSINYSQNVVINSALNENSNSIIMTSRPDIRFSRKADFNFINKIDKNNFYICCNQNNSNEFQDFSACDLINIAHSKVFQKKINFFNLNKFLFAASHKKNGEFYEEFSLQEKIKLKKCNLKYLTDWKIQRPLLAGLNSLFKNEKNRD